MSIRILEGSARLVTDNGEEVVTKDAKIKVGDEIDLRRGKAEIRLKPGRLFEAAQADLTVLSGTSLQLRRGRLLADLTKPGSVNTETSMVSGNKTAFRLDRGLATRVGVYAGSIRLTGENAVKTKIPAYRQGIVAGGVIPRAAKPLRISQQDEWDRRYLAEALDLDLRLANFGVGLEGRLGPGEGITFFNKVLPDFDLSFLDNYLVARRSDVLIAAMLSLITSQGLGDTPADRLDRVWSLWSEGASWGLVAVEHRIIGSSLFDGLIAALARAGIAILIPGGRPGSSGPAPSPDPSPSRGPGSPAPQPSPSPNAGPKKAPVPGPARDVLPDALEEILDSIYGTLSPPLP